MDTPEFKTEIKRESVDSHQVTIQEIQQADDTLNTPEKIIRSAEINFIEGDFSSCTYSMACGGSNYDFEDWIFVGRIANEITKLQKKFDNGKNSK